MMLSTDGLKKFALGERLVRRNPLLYPAARKTLADIEQMDCRGRQQWTQSRLRHILRLAMRTPYGRTVGGNEHPDSWPLLDKQTVRNQPAAFARAAWFAARASTSGTTGTPLTLWRPARAIAFEQACVDHVFEQIGVHPEVDRIAVLRGDSAPTSATTDRHGFARLTLGGRKLLLASNQLSPATLNEYVDALERFVPDVLFAYPSSLENLAYLLAVGGRRLHIPRVVTSSEVLRPEAWQLIQETFGCRLADYYGQAERLAFASAFKPAEYRFLSAYAHVELLPVESTPEGNRLYEIVGTSLWNTTMPLVRYRTGDFVRLPQEWTERELTEVCHGMRDFSGVIGRDHDVLLTPDGVQLNGLGIMARGIHNVVRFQLIQPNLEEVRILLIPGPGYSGGDEAKLLENARARIPEPMRIHLETTAMLERTAQGKTPFVIHGPAVREALRQRAAGGISQNPTCRA